MFSLHYTIIRLHDCIVGTYVTLPTPTSTTSRAIIAMKSKYSVHRGGVAVVSVWSTGSEPAHCRPCWRPFHVLPHHSCRSNTLGLSTLILGGWFMSGGVLSNKIPAMTIRSTAQRNGGDAATRRRHPCEIVGMGVLGQGGGTSLNFRRVESPVHAACNCSRKPTSSCFTASWKH